ncbi:hypothetical protein AMK26_03840 [Streptomyces sp. CB03234]|uniref:GNAT family N-acetyltransferase n=1 Tax=Streptomyces sp. (strain CB03234) TaxID=1703937 RepID=UPI00093A306B|nr:GNAT family N-acetyltransferase [Streptomyces sp. CB03234]OKK08163.1 hypothetical protein AMK26_03840 [Streptomyces sp. CB03234]
MSWQLTHGVEDFRRTAGPYLDADPAGCTVLLTVAETVRRHGPRPYADEDDDARFGWWRRTAGGPVEAAFVQTPPKAPLLGPMPDEAARELAEALRGTYVAGVKGADGPAQAFAAAWTGSGGAWTAVRRTRLFRLGDLTPPCPAPPGTARRATAADVPLAAGQSRVSPVYTPPELRGRGYAGAVTAAVSRAAQDAGARQVLLFADAANPTSTALYQRLGYRPAAEHLDIGFA